jgi:hypothetical protein
MATMLPGAQPFTELESVLAPIATVSPDELASAMSNGERGIGAAVERALPDDQSNLLLVIDQFEELFTQADTATTNRFLQSLLVAIREPRSRLRVVLTVRADFWDRPLAHTRLATMLESASVSISPLAADELEQAIVAPAIAEGVDYEPGLVARIIADVADQPGALPLLQFALTELFDRAQSGLISATAYDAIGGMAGALAQRAEGVYLEFDGAQREACRRLFSRLVALGEGIDDTRRRIPVSELGSDSGVADVVDALGAARLLTFDRDPATRMPTVEIAHEALIHAWPRLRDWVDDGRDDIRVHRQLTAASTEWQRTGLDPDELYRGGRLEAALALQDSDPAVLNETETAFVAASREQALAVERRSRRRTRILQSLLGLTTILLAVALVATFVAVDSAEDADAARDDALSAQADLREERDQLIATQQDLEIEVLRGRLANLAEEGSPALASLLAVELYRLDPSAASLDRMADVLFAQPGWKGTIPGVWIDLSAVGLVTIEASAVVVRDPDDLSVLRRIPVDPITGASGQVPLIPVLDPEGRRIAIGQRGGLRIVDLASGDKGPVIEANVGFDEGRAIAWTSDGQALVVISGPQQLDVLAIDDLAARPIGAYDVGEPMEPWLVAHPSEPRIVVASSSGGFLNFDTTRVAEGLLIPSPAADVPGISFGFGVRLSQPGGRVSAVFGGTTVFDQAQLRATLALATTDVPLGWVETLADGTIFAGGGLGIPAILVDSETSEIVGGPWRPGDDIEAFAQPVLTAGGDEIAVVLMGSRDGSAPTIHRFSRVGGDALSETLPSFPIAGFRRPDYLPEANVVVRGGAWSLTEEGLAQVDLGVPINTLAAASTDSGDVVIVGGPEGRITVHEVPSGRRLGPEGSEIRVENILAAPSTGMSLSSDGRSLVVVSTNPFEVHVFDLATGRLRKSFPIGGNAGGIASLRAGKAVISGRDRSAPERVVESLVIDLETLAEDYRGPLEVQDVTAGGDRYLAGRDPVQLLDSDTLEVIWSGPSGITPLSLHASVRYVLGNNFFHFQVIDIESASVVGPVTRGMSQYSGQGIAIQLTQGRAHLRNADPDTWPMAACEAAGRNLTRAEWKMYLPQGLEYAPSCPRWPVDP